MLLGGVSSIFAQGTAFTYQGRLTENGSPANGDYDLQFVLFSALTVGNPVGPTNTVAPVPVSNGLFTVTLDFGSVVFDGSARWLEIALRTNGSAGAYTPLAPRQPVTPAPYAIHAFNAGLLNGQASTAFAPVSGSANYVAKAGDTMTGTLNLPANGLVAGGNQFVLSGGGVGIGTAIPSEALDVAGTVKANVFAGPEFNYANTGGRMRFRIASNNNPEGGGFVDVLTIDNDTGNVGIGTTTPSAKLDVAGTVKATSFMGDGAGITNVAVAGVVPIGSVIDWWRPNSTFSVPTGYKICDGTTIADPDSPYDGNVVPNLLNRFVRGVTDPNLIGTTGGADDHGHTGSTSVVANHTHIVASAVVGFTPGGSGLFYCPPSSSTSSAGSHSHSLSTSGSSNVPVYVGLLKIMRIK